MKYWLLLVGRDWMRAPISGTLAILWQLLAIWALWQGLTIHGLLALVLSQVTLLGRGTYRVKTVPVEVQAAISIARHAADQVNGRRDYVLSRDEAAAIRLVCNTAEHE